MSSFLPQQKNKINLLQVFAILTLLLNLSVLSFIILQGLIIRQLTNQKPPTFIETIDNPTDKANHSLEPNPKTIIQFVSTTMTAIFNWSGSLPPQTVADGIEPQTDQGITVKTPPGHTKKIASSTWVASFGLSEDFRPGFLAEIADMTPSDIFTKQTNSKISGELVIQRIYPPEKIAPGNWRLGMVANIVQKRGDKQKIIIPFNKDFLVRSVDYYQHPLYPEITPLQQAIYQWRSQKLEIYEITDLCIAYSGKYCQPE